MLEWLTRWEPLWLFLILAAELGFSIRSWIVLEKEFSYDKDFNEQYIIPKKRFKEKKAAMKAKPHGVALVDDPTKVIGEPNVNVVPKQN